MQRGGDYLRFEQIVRVAAIVPALLVIARLAVADQPAKVLPAATPARVCVQVQIGSGQPADFRCLNDLMEKLVAQEGTKQAALQAVRDGVTSLAPTQEGLFNTTATHERLGNAFGHSAFPQRPPVGYHVPLLHQ